MPPPSRSVGILDFGENRLPPQWCLLIPIRHRSIQSDTKLVLDVYLSSRYDIPVARQRDYRFVSPFDGSTPTSPALGRRAGPRTAGSVANPTPSTVKMGSGNCGKCGN